VSGLVFAEDEKVVLVARQKAGDRGPIDGVMSGLEQAEAELGVNTRFIEALDRATKKNTLRTLARRGTDVSVTTCFAMGAAVLGCWGADGGARISRHSFCCHCCRSA